MEIDLEWKHLHIPSFLCVSGFAFLIENAFVYPLFVIKTKEQIATSQATRNLQAGKTIFRSIIQQNGFKGLYRGYFFACAAGMPSFHAYMLTYHYTKHKLSKSDSQIVHFSAPMFSGILAEALSLTIYVPIDIITQRLQLSENSSKNVRKLAKQIYKEKGITEFYKGFGVTVLTLGIGSATWWLCYEQFKALFNNFQAKYFVQTVNALSGTSFIDDSSKFPSFSLFFAETVGKGPKPGSIFAGILAGCSATIISQPFDVVKTRMQTAKSHSVEHNYKSIFQGFKSVYRTEGFKGFLRGLPSKILGRVPINAVVAFGYELVLYYSIPDTEE